MSTKRQKCPRCNSHRLKTEWAPKSWGRPGKWCRACKAAQRGKVKGAKSAPRKKVSKNPDLTKAHKVGKVLKKALVTVPALS